MIQEAKRSQTYHHRPITKGVQCSIHINIKYQVSFKHFVWLSDTEYNIMTNTGCWNSDITFFY